LFLSNLLIDLALRSNKKPHSPQEQWVPRLTFCRLVHPVFTESTENSTSFSNSKKMAADFRFTHWRRQNHSVCSFSRTLDWQVRLVRCTRQHRKEFGDGLHSKSEPDRIYGFGTPLSFFPLFTVSDLLLQHLLSFRPDSNWVPRSTNPVHRHICFGSNNCALSRYNALCPNRKTASCITCVYGLSGLTST
jgi:hypothetical protein